MASLQLSSLPRDIIVDNILPFLSIRDFLNFSATCKAFFVFSTDEVYWRKLTASTFRLPAQPIRKNGWRELYKNLANAKLFTWGHNQNGRLGHSDPSVHNHGGMVMYGVSTPTEVSGLDREVVVDVKAGGWSTTVLTSKGAVFSCGSLHAGQYPIARTPVKLKFPHKYPTKIAQISSGRSHILGLSDEGRIWQWKKLINAKFIKFMHVDTRDYTTDYFGTGRPKGTVEKVVAGWDHNAALVNGVGIVVWFDIDSNPEEQSDMMLCDGEVVPGTYLTGCADQREISDPLASIIGEVIDLIAGEGFLVFLTKAGGVFAVDTSRPGAVAGVAPVRLNSFSAPMGQEPMSYISGSFRRFAVFNKGGLVYLGRKEIVQAALENSQQSEWEADDAQIMPEILPALQNRQIVAIEFGDYHALALTASGKVYSWGVESATCGCLGLGVREVARRRGVDYTHRDGILNEPTEVYFGDKAKPGKASVVSSESEVFVFNIAAAGWHSGALALVPASYKSVGEGEPKKQSSDDEAQVYPRRLSQPYRTPHHFNRPPGEAGHGGIVHRQSPLPTPTSPIPGVIQSSSSTLPFIRTGPVLPMPGSNIAPVRTGGPHSNEHHSSDEGIEGAEDGELEEGTGSVRVCRIG